MIDIAIVGAGPAGYSAAITARKRDKSVVVIGQHTGWLSRAHSISNYPGLPDISGADLLNAMRDQAVALGAQTRPGVVNKIVSMGSSFALSLGGDFIEARHIILCTGAKQPRLLPGESELLGRGVSYCALCDGPFFDGQDVAVAGGGNTAFEDALFLAGRCRSVTLIHRRKTFRAEEALVEQAAQRKNLTILTDTVITDLHADNGELEHLLLKNADGRETRLPVSGLFVAFGRVPDTEMAAALAERDQEGYLLTNDRMETAAPGFFAAGDCRHKQVRQLTTAVSDGTLAAVSACRWLAEQ